MTNERESLWTNERIGVNSSEATDELDGGPYRYHVISQLLVKIRGDYEAQLANQYQRIELFVELVNQLEAHRNNYEARIAELEAQLAQRWESLPISQVVQYNGEWPVIPAEYANDQIALCRLVTQEPTPAIPPDVRCNCDCAACSYCYNK